MLKCVKSKACQLTFPDTVLLFPNFIFINLLTKPEESSRSLQLYVLGYLGMLVCENPQRGIPGCNLKVAPFNRGQGQIREKGMPLLIGGRFNKQGFSWVTLQLSSFLHRPPLPGQMWVQSCTQSIQSHHHTNAWGSFWEWWGCRASS